MIKEMRIEFLVANQGNVFNPQPRIVAAEFSYVTVDVSHEVSCIGPSCYDPFGIEVR